MEENQHVKSGNIDESIYPELTCWFCIHFLKIDSGSGCLFFWFINVQYKNKIFPKSAAVFSLFFDTGNLGRVVCLYLLVFTFRYLCVCGL